MKIRSDFSINQELELEMLPSATSPEKTISIGGHSRNHIENGNNLTAKSANSRRLTDVDNY